VGVPPLEAAASGVSQGVGPVLSPLALFAMLTRGARRRAEAEAASAKAAATVRTKVLEATKGKVRLCYSQWWAWPRFSGNKPGRARSVALEAQGAGVQVRGH
jgi:hypothetical protein